jgi:hypothetical protein
MFGRKREAGVPRRAVSALIATVLAFGVGAAIVAITAGSSDREVTCGGGSTVGAGARIVAAATPLLGRSQYLRLAEQGIAHTSMWWDRKLHWYCDALSDHKRKPLATVWDTNGLFEALDEVALADPTAHNLDAVKSFANYSQPYWNPDLEPHPGFSPYPGDRGRHQETFYDDNGWLGLAFLDADLATHSRRYLHDAERAFSYIAAGGWDKAAGGGMWWTNQHQWRSGEALAADADLAARLYHATGEVAYLKRAQTYIGWANKHLRQPNGVYIRTASTPYPHLTLTTTSTPTPTLAPTKGTVFTKLPPCGTKNRCAVRRGNPHPGKIRPCAANHQCVIRGGNPHPGKPVMVAMPHDGEGAMLSAMVTLCQATRDHSWCSEAERLANAETVWLAPFTDGPQYDSILIRGLLNLYTVDHRPRWYRFAAELAALIVKNAPTSSGVYLRGWDGAAVPGASPGMLRTDAGSISVFADLATVTPPT